MWGGGDTNVLIALICFFDWIIVLFCFDDFNFGEKKTVFVSQRERERLLISKLH